MELLAILKRVQRLSKIPSTAAQLDPFVSDIKKQVTLFRYIPNTWRQSLKVAVSTALTEIESDDGQSELSGDITTEELSAAFSDMALKRMVFKDERKYSEDEQRALILLRRTDFHYLAFGKPLVFYLDDHDHRHKLRELLNDQGIPVSVKSITNVGSEARVMQK